MAALQSLPLELHDAILDYALGTRTRPPLHPPSFASNSNTPSTVASSTGRWVRDIRHPRRKEVSDLALVCPAWREAIQARIYSHIILKGTVDCLDEAKGFLAEHPHLAQHIRHIEIWVPQWSARSVFEADNRAVLPRNFDWANERHVHRQADGLRKASLELIFGFVKGYLPRASVLSIEGGHCKKPRLIRHFERDQQQEDKDEEEEGNDEQQHLPVLPSITTLVLRGCWNLMRSHAHWQHITRALPHLSEAQLNYAAAKPAAYTTVARLLARLHSQQQPALKNLHLSLEGFHYDWGYFRGVRHYDYGTYARRSSGVETALRQGEGNVNVPPRGVYMRMPGGRMMYSNLPHAHATLPHLCRLMGVAMTRLEVFSLNGRCCSWMFEIARDLLRQSGERGGLKVVDLALKGCCSEEERRKRPGGMGAKATHGGGGDGEGDGDSNMADAPPLNVPLPDMSGNYTFDGPIWANVGFADDDHTAEEDEETASDLDSNSDDEDEDEDVATAFQQPAPSSNAYILSTGLPNPNFLRLVKLFEKLVLSVVLALEVFPHLNSIRIRFVELDSKVGLANPYFEVKGGIVYGVWSDRIVRELRRVRPHWRYVELDGEVPRIEAGSGMRLRERERERGSGGVRKRTAGRPRSVKIEAYRGIAVNMIEDYLHGR